MYLRREKAAAMTGDGELCSDAVADVPKDLRSIQGFVSEEEHSFSAQGPSVSAEEGVSIIPYNQTSVITLFSPSDIDELHLSHSLARFSGFLNLKEVCDP